jgi:pyruvate dehydrogenase E2 component (dihydrolipoamide acetyltransferase)
MDRPTPITELSPLKGETTVVEPDRIERAIGRRSAETRATVPDVQYGIDVSGDVIFDQAERGSSLTAILARACATALVESPRANAAYRDGRFELYSRINIGVVLSGEEGQIAPTILDADTKTAEQLSEEIKRLAGRALAGELTPPELAGATFTLSDLSEFGVHRADAMIVPPQAAALAAGAIRSVATVRDGTIVAGRELSLTLACDHRILYGARAAAFLARIAELLEHADQ